MDEFERELLDIERTVTDPNLTVLVQEAKDINELLSAQVCTEEEAQQIISTLNRRWVENGFHDIEFFLSGEAYVGGVFEDFEKDSVLDEAVKASFSLRYPFVSEGFCLIQSTELTEDGFEIRQEIVARGRIIVDDDDGVGGQADEPCFIKLNETNRIECDVITPGKAEVWLATYHLELYEELANIALQSSDEAEATMLLRDMNFSVNQKLSVDEVKDLWMNLEVYLNYALEYDRDVPYLAELCGECDLLPVGKTEFQPMQMISEQSNLLLINELFFAYNTDTHKLVPYVRGMVVLGKKRTHATIHVPFTTIQSIEAGRPIYRARQQEKRSL